jgi:DNA-binding XRE family transcriptional regulator
MLTHDKFIKKMLKDPTVKKEYDALEGEFSLLKEMLRARKKAGLTQAEIARLMGTKTPAIARIESGGGKKKHSPSLATLRKYAEAVGCRLQVKFVSK